jgi:PAT family beta-lactamase induction signal transducer AmpG
MSPWMPFAAKFSAINELGLGNSVHVNAYRIAGLVPGSLSLILADLIPWAQVFWITAAFMVPGMVMVLLVDEPAVVAAPKTLRQAVVEPFHEFIGRKGWRGRCWCSASFFSTSLAIRWPPACRRRSISISATA